MKLTYWLCSRLDGEHATYAIRERTKKAALAAREAWGEGYEAVFAAPVKVTIEYRDAFDLMTKIMGEGGFEPLVGEGET